MTLPLPSDSPLRRRSVSPRQQWQLEQAGVHPLLARLFAGRGVADRESLDPALTGLIPPQRLTHVDEAAELLADALEAEARLLIVADYDCDGATACALAIRALRACGATVDYVVPDRFSLGYGLSPAVVDLAAERHPDLIITVDNGIASVEGVARAQALGISTLITDHHLPGEQLPAADCIVNPNQPGCAFPSKALAGVGVMFYVLLALRATLRSRAWFETQGISEPNFAQWLDLVALGTVADVVPLDRNNRILVAQGIKRIRAGRAQAGIQALFTAAGRSSALASASDLGFLIGPRLNAAGRLADMGLGIECLLTDDPLRALEIAQSLDALNQERREIEADMQAQAHRILETLDESVSSAGLALFDPEWHQGVVGIVAARIKDRLHRPVFVFARGDEGLLKGSGRSIPGIHLKDVLDALSKANPSLLLAFGGHAAAAGCTLREADFENFRAQFTALTEPLLSEDIRHRTLTTDGELEEAYLNLPVARMLVAEVWGQGFPPPLFEGVFEVESIKLLKDKHLKLRLRYSGGALDGIYFNAPVGFTPRAGTPVRLAFRLEVNHFNGREMPQLLIEHLEPNVSECF